MAINVRNSIFIKSGIKSAIFKAINETDVVGIRIESAIKPKLEICGITFSNVFAAPVEDRMILLSTERFFLKSDVPDEGTLHPKHFVCWWQHARLTKMQSIRYSFYFLTKV